jgi:hypothetical protein
VIFIINWLLYYIYVPSFYIINPHIVVSTAPEPVTWQEDLILCIASPTEQRKVPTNIHSLSGFLSLGAHAASGITINPSTHTTVRRHTLSCCWLKFFRQPTSATNTRLLHANLFHLFMGCLTMLSVAQAIYRGYYLQTMCSFGIYIIWGCYLFTIQYLPLFLHLQFL